MMYIHSNNEIDKRINVDKVHAVRPVDNNNMPPETPTGF